MHLISSDVVTPATNIDLITLGDVKEEFGITSTDQDVYLQKLISRSSSAVASYCRRVFAQQTYQDLFLYNWARREYNTLMLKNRPVVVSSVNAIWDKGTPLITGDDFKIDTMGFMHDFNIFGRRLSVVYSAGWILPGDPGVSNLPLDIQLAVIQIMVAARQAGRLSFTERDPFLRGETVEGLGSFQYSSNPIGSGSGGFVGGIPEGAANSLAAYVIPVNA